MLQAAFLDGQFLDFLPFSDDGFSAPKVDVSWGQIAEVFVVTTVVVVADEVSDCLFEHPWKVVFLKQDAVLEGLCQRSVARQLIAEQSMRGILLRVWGWFGAPRT